MFFVIKAGLVTVASFLAVAGASAQTSQPAALPETDSGRAMHAYVGNENWPAFLDRLHQVSADISTRGLRTFPGTSDKMLTGYPYNEFYDWDLYFENIYLTYFGVSDYCFTNLKQFLDRQEPDGYINRSLIKKRDRQHFKPFLAQLAVMGTKMRGDDYSWAKDKYYDRLKKYVDKWFSYDGDGNGLPVWNSADHAGTDNQWSRGGPLASFQTEGVDLACYLVRELQAMAIMADHLGKSDDQAAFTAHAARLSKLINETFWDEKAGFYFDRNQKTGQPIPVKSVAGFTPLYVGIASPEQARRLIHDHLLNEKEFWTPYPVASYAKTEPDYYQAPTSRECNWRGPTWAPTNYMIFHGLIRYGYAAEAKELSARLFKMALLQNAATREYYNAETGSGFGQTKFWGFSVLYYTMPLEQQLGYDPTDLTAPYQPMLAQSLQLKYP